MQPRTFLRLLQASDNTRVRLQDAFPQLADIVDKVVVQWVGLHGTACLNTPIVVSKYGSKLRADRQCDVAEAAQNRNLNVPVENFALQVL